MIGFVGRLLGRFSRLGIPFAWLQITAERKRYAAASAGMAFAVLMMLLQVGLHSGLYEQGVRPFRKLDGDIAIVSSQYEYLCVPRGFSADRLHRAAALPEVAEVAPLWLCTLPLKNPRTGQGRDVFVMAFDPSDRVFNDPEIEALRPTLASGNTLLFDRWSNANFGDFDQLLAARNGDGVRTELNEKAMSVRGTFRLGQTLGIDGNVIAGRDAFLRSMPGASPDFIMMGLVKLKPGADAAAVATRIGELLPKDVKVYTREQLIAAETEYWDSRTPIGVIILSTMVLSFIVGAVVVFQILYTDVTDHLPEYATLKSIGFADGYFRKIVIQESVILSISGFIPGALLTGPVYAFLKSQTGIPVGYTAFNLSLVLLVSMTMCVIAGLGATHKLAHANPADIV